MRASLRLFYESLQSVKRTVVTVTVSKHKGRQDHICPGPIDDES